MITLRSSLLPDDETWEFTFPPNSLTSRPPRAGLVYGKAISLRRSNDEATTTLEMTLRMEQFPSNRILNSDDTSKFVLLSIDRSFRFPEQPMKVGVEYLVRLFKRGVWLNGIQYRFYGHSNSQLVCKSLLRCCSSPELFPREVVLVSFVKLVQMPNWMIEYT